MDQNMTAAVGPPPVEFEYRRLTREELDAILTRQTFMRAPSGNFECIGLHGGSTVEPYYYDFHGISQPTPKVVYLKVQKADYSRVDLEVGTEGDNVAQARQNAALKASRRDTLNRLAGAAGRPALYYDEAVQLAVDALKDRRELLEQLEEAKASARASQKSVADAHECLANVSTENEDLRLKLHNLRVQLNGSERNCKSLRTEYDQVSNAHDRLLKEDDALRTQLTDLLTCVMDVGDAGPMDLPKAVSNVAAWVVHLRQEKLQLQQQLEQEIDARKAAQARAGQRARRIAELEEKLVGGAPFSTEYDARRMTPAQFMELAQTFFARRSVWTADEAWVKERLVYLASIPPGKFIPEVVAIRMCEMALNPTSPSPAQRAKMEGDGKAEFLDVWLRELGEDRQWLGSAGGPAFGPVGQRDWKTRTLRSEYEVRPAAQLALPEVFVRMAPGARRQRVHVVSHFHRDREVLGFFDDMQFIPLSLCIVEDITPHGFQEADLGDLQVAQQVVVRDDVNGEPMWVEVASRAHVTPDGTAEAAFGYYQLTESGGMKFTPFTRETYVKTRGAK